MAKEVSQNEITRAQSKAVGGGRKRCTKGKSCSATCIANGLLCRVDLPAPLLESVGKAINAIKNSNEAAPVIAKTEPNSKDLEPKFNQGVARFKNLVKRVINKVKGPQKEPEPPVERSRPPQPATEDKSVKGKEKKLLDQTKQIVSNVLDSLARAKEGKQIKVEGSVNPDKVKWSSVEGSGSRFQGGGTYGSFFTVPTKKLLGFSDNMPENIGVKVGRIGQGEPFIAKKLGDSDLGPKLIAAKFLNKAISSTDSGTVHKGVMAMEVVPGQPYYKIPNKTINGINTKDAYWKARSQLHKMGIAHNDAHGGNVIIDDRGKARFVDLGLAKRSWRAALAEALGGHTGADFSIATVPRWDQEQIFDRNYSKVKDILKQNGFSNSEIKEIAIFGTQRSDDEIKGNPLARVSVPLAKQLIATFYEDI